MQRYLMAEPTTRQMYIDQRCDGYSDTYVDVDPGTIGPAHYDYRRATDGLLMDSPTPDANGDYGWTAVTYMEELLPDDVELTLSEQVDIQYSWQWLKAIMAEGEQDPVSRYNADLT